MLLTSLLASMSPCTKLSGVGALSMFADFLSNECKKETWLYGSND